MWLFNGVLHAVLITSLHCVWYYKQRSQSYKRTNRWYIYHSYFAWIRWYEHEIFILTLVWCTKTYQSTYVCCKDAHNMLIMKSYRQSHFRQITKLNCLGWTVLTVNKQLRKVKRKWFRHLPLHYCISWQCIKKLIDT